MPAFHVMSVPAARMATWYQFNKEENLSTCLENVQNLLKFSAVTKRSIRKSKLSNLKYTKTQNTFKTLDSCGIGHSFV